LVAAEELLSSRDERVRFYTDNYFARQFARPLVEADMAIYEHFMNCRARSVR